jgi:hypothetical protein
VKGLLKLLREALPEIIGGLVVAAVLALISALNPRVGIWAVMVTVVGGIWLGCAYLAFKRTPPLVEGGNPGWLVITSGAVRPKRPPPDVGAHRCFSPNSLSE